MHIGVGHALDAANHAAAESLRDDVAAMIDLEQRRKHQPVHAGLQGADLSGELQRQHRHGAVRKIHAGSAQEGLFVDRRTGLDVMADVGDVNVQRVVAINEPVNPNRIVEIARGLTIDGDDVEMPEILAPRQLV